MLRGKIAKRAKEARKGLSPNLGKKNYIKFTNKRKQQKKKNKLTLPIPSKPSMTFHETKSTTHQAHHYPTLAHKPHTHTHTHTEIKQNKTKTKHQKQARLVGCHYCIWPV